MTEIDISEYCFLMALTYYEVIHTLDHLLK